MLWHKRDWEDNLLHQLKDKYLHGAYTDSLIAYVNDCKIAFIDKDEFGYEMKHVFCSGYGNVEVRFDDKVKRGQVLLS